MQLAWVLLLVYATLNLFYCLRGKHVPLLDVFLLSSGFVIRVLLGCALVHVEPSNWLLLCSSTLALFLALAKRWGDLAKGMDAEHGDCALVSIVGTLDIDFQALTDKMGSQMSGMGQDDISITNSVMAAKTCWDDESKLTVWSQTDMSFTMHMANPMDPQEDLAMPIQETIRTTCEIKES